MTTDVRRRPRRGAELETLISAAGFGGLTDGELTYLNPSGDVYPASRSVNFRRTASGALVKRCGTRVAFESGENVRALYLGSTAAMADQGDKWYCVCGGALYRRDVGGGGTAVIGAVPASGDCAIFPFGGMIYVLCGGGYYVTDGVSLSQVSGYVPVVTVASSGEGAKAVCEQPNILTKEVTDRFVLSSAASRFDLSRYPENGTSVSVRVDGEPAVSWQLIRAIPVSYMRPPSEIGAGHTVDVTYAAAGNSPYRDKLLSQTRAAVWGGKNDESLILWGGGGAFFVSESEGGRYPSAEYFPENGAVSVGSGEPPTAFVHHGSNSLVFTRSVCRMLSQRIVRRGILAGDSGYLVREWNMSALTGAAGAYTVGGAAEVDGCIFSADAAGVWLWKAGYIAGERNAEMIASAGGVPGVTAALLESCTVLRDRTHGELWLASSAGTVAVYHRASKRWYTLEIPPFDSIWDTPLGPACVSGGRVTVFDELCETDAGGEPVSAEFVGLWTDCGGGRQRKTLRMMTAYLGAGTDACEFTAEADCGCGEPRRVSVSLENGTHTVKRCVCEIPVPRVITARVRILSPAGACRVDTLTVGGYCLYKRRYKRA